MSKAWSTEKFIETCNNSPKVKKGYDYSKVVYINAIVKIEIGCYNKEHGVFFIRPDSFLSGATGCRICNSNSIKNRLSSNIEEFIKKCKNNPNIRKDFDFSRVKYINNHTKIEIGCPMHGFFKTTPSMILQERDCPKCALINLSKKLTSNSEEFVKKALLSEKVKKGYDYSKIDYVKSTIKIEIGCYEKEHGFFFITPGSFLNGSTACKECLIAVVNRLTTEEFIEKAKNNPNVKEGYDYSKVFYINMNTKVKIGCYNKEHGFFHITPSSFLTGSTGCKFCSYKHFILNTKDFIEKAKNSTKVTKKYDYSQVNYVNSTIRIKIGCLEHGFFNVKPDLFLDGQDCPKCTGHFKPTTQEFIEKCKKSHKVKVNYDYSQVNYINCKIKVKIGCLIHGIFEITPDHFIQGKGCPKCIQGFGEYFTTKVFSLLFNEEFIKIKPDWMINPKTNRKLELDGYCEKLKLAFEYQGIQHEEVIVKFRMTEEDLAYGKYKDQIKRDICKEKNILLIEVPQFGRDFRPESLKNFIKQKCIKQNYYLPDNFDDIIINVDEIQKEFLEQKINKLSKIAKNDDKFIL